MSGAEQVNVARLYDLLALPHLDPARVAPIVAYLGRSTPAEWPAPVRSLMALPGAADRDGSVMAEIFESLAAGARPSRRILAICRWRGDRAPLA